MKVAVIGFATEGQVSYKYYKNLGHDVTICDQNTKTTIPEDAKSQLGNEYLDNLDRFDVIVRSAGINPQIILDKNPNVLPKITSAVNEFLAECVNRQNVIGVTGTKGKGTTSTLISKIIEANDQAVYLGGNIGRSPLEFIDELTPESWVILELSSFQLCDIKHSPHIMTCLMVVPEHLDWHSDLDDYIDAKSQAFINQKRDDVAIYFAENELSEDIANSSEGQVIPYYEEPGALIKNNCVIIDGREICKTNDIKLLGKHNLQNICAAITTVWQAGFRNINAIKSVITSFSGLEYRLQKVRELDGVSYFNDSFGTTPETTIVALQAFKQPKILIVGGSDKGVPFDALAKEIASSDTRAVIAIGDTGPVIAKLVQRINPNLDIITGLEKMPEIVNKARELSNDGDVVLLSCGSASFGLFKDYKDRGQQFNQAVKDLS